MVVELQAIANHVLAGSELNINADKKTREPHLLYRLIERKIEGLLTDISPIMV